LILVCIRLSCSCEAFHIPNNNSFLCSSNVHIIESKRKRRRRKNVNIIHPYNIYQVLEEVFAVRFGSVLSIKVIQTTR